MTATALPTPILALEVTGPAASSPRDLLLAREILSELVGSVDTCGDAQVTTSETGLYLLFWASENSPVLSALSLWEMLRDLPAMTVRIGLHFGPVDVEEGARGEGIDAIRRLLDTGEAGQILMSEEFAATLKGLDSQRLVILDPDEDPTLADELESALRGDGHETSRDLRSARGVTWARAMETRIRGADAVVAFVSERSAESELLQYLLEIAVDERRRRGRPHIIPVWLNQGPSTDASLSALERSLRQATWTGREDTSRVVEEVRSTLSKGQVEIEPETAGGAVSGHSPFYIRRPGDDDFESALNRHESIVLVKGPRQVGKTSLIGRGVEIAEESGWRSVTTDFQKLSSRQLESDASFYRVVATTLARQAGFEFDFESEWLDALGENMNMDGFMRELLKDSDQPLVWFMDEADRLFSAPFASDFFGLVRSWHNARATDRRGPWGRLTIVIGYATEVHLFIKDLNQSPFNVGCPIDLTMFTLENTAELNMRYGRSIASIDDVRALHRLVGGHPFLTRRAFDVLIKGKISVAELLAQAEDEDGPFGDHLKRVLVSVTQLPGVWDALVQSLNSPDLPDSEGLHRLVAAGVLIRRSGRNYELPCELYKRFLARYVQTGAGK